MPPEPVRGAPAQGAAASTVPSSGRLILAVAILASLCLMFLPLYVNRVDSRGPRPLHGEMAFAPTYRWASPIGLTGVWRLEWRSPDLAHGPRAGDSVEIHTPGLWDGILTAEGGRLPRLGWATYHLTLRGVPAGSYVLFVPTIFHASQVWVNGRLLSRMGQVGPTARTTRYLWRAHEVQFDADGSPVRLAIDVAAFHHSSDGLEAAPVLGRTEVMRTWLILEWAKDLLFDAVLLILVAFCMVVYVFRRDVRSPLYLAVSLILFLPVNLILGHDNVVSILDPDLNFSLMLYLEYIAGLFAVVFLLEYVKALFSRENIAPLYTFCTISLFTWALVITLAMAIGGTLLVSSLFKFAMISAGGTLLYILLMVSLAVRRGRHSALIFLFGIGVCLISVLMAMVVETDLLPRDQVIGIDFFPLGLVVFGFAQIIILAERWSIAQRDAEAMAVDLRRLMEVSSSITAEIDLPALLRRIVEATSKFLQADRGTLYLHDPKTNELWSMVAEGIETRQIRMAADRGVAGDSFSRGEVSLIDNAYGDPRFNRAVDETTGYVTRTLLTMPILTRDGRRLGVMQALNRVGRGGFDAADVGRMRAFAAQAAVALDNATLFQDVVTERNYNESILASMAGGVITLSAEGRVEKLNPAAARILELEPSPAPGEQIIGQAAQDLLTEDNAWLLAELNAMRGDRTARAMLDVDIRTANGRTTSVNLSIVPLVSGETSVGLLILIEDISQEKRLESAMRRFMTQKVVDQVLHSREEPLFGSACVASVLFADIRGFTSMAEHLGPRETVDMLNEVFGDLVEAVTGSDGVVDKFIGDAIMAVYGAPISSGRDPLNAVESAIAMMHMVATLNLRRGARGQPPLRLGIGIATGEVIAGTIGSPKRMDYTVIGDSVNLAARLQDLTKAYGVGVIICDTTAAAVAGTQVLRHLDTLEVRGRQRTERLFEVLTHHTEATFPRLREVLAAYDLGMSRLRAGDHEGAAAAFAAALALHPADRPSAIMLERARAAAGAGG